MTELLQVTAYHIDFRIAVIAVDGELDMDTCPLLQATLAEALASHRPPLLAIDLSGLTLADSYGLTVLIATHEHARTLGGRALVCAAGDLTQATFRRRGLDQVLDIRPTLSEAVRELRAFQPPPTPGPPTG